MVEYTRTILYQLDKYFLTLLMDSMYCDDSLIVVGYTLGISVESCSKFMRRMFVIWVYFGGSVFLHYTITWIIPPSMYDMTDSSYTIDPISTGPKNCTSSI